MRFLLSRAFGWALVIEDVLASPIPGIFPDLTPSVFVMTICSIVSNRSGRSHFLLLAIQSGT